MSNKDQSEDKGLLVTFYMNGGHTIEVRVKEITMKRDSDGRYSGYEIKWLDSKEGALPFFSLSIPDIVAVRAVNWPY